VILTPADLELLTGRTRHSAQRRVLDAHLPAGSGGAGGEGPVMRRVKSSL
jgi:hypothetical protein